MNKVLPVGVSLFRFRYSHLPEAPPDDDDQKWIFKTFGFFDVLTVDDVDKLKDPEAPPATTNSEDRHQRILHAFGSHKRVTEILNEAVREPRYLAVSLVKLTGDSSHGAYHTFVEQVLATQCPNEVFLGCLDAPDLIVLSVFGGPTSPPDTGASPLQSLVNWMESLRVVEPLAGHVERTLTLVSCKSLKRFIEKLAVKDKGSKVKALVRMTDSRNGAGLRAIRQHFAGLEASKNLLESSLFSSVGYYDIQGIVTVPEAAAILSVADEFVQKRELMTSTGILSIPNLIETGAVVDPPRANPKLRDALNKEWDRLKVELARLKDAGCLNVVAWDVAAELVNRFDRLTGTGLIPGSRQLLWTTRDSIKTFADECMDHLAQRGTGSRGPQADQDSDFHVRQRQFTTFHRAICDELDRRVSLSLPAHTRFFPCAIEAPLKVVGALDIVGRLVAASFRSYRCLEQMGLLQVFITRGDKPSEFFDLRRQGANASTRLPFPTMVITHFTPRMVQHFYLALFTVFHEVAQCIISDVITWPSFSGLVFSQAFLERLGIISSLACERKGTSEPVSVQPFMHEWCANFLATEIGIPTVLKAPLKHGPDYFAAPGVDLSKYPSAGGGWATEAVWQSQIDCWRPTRITAGEYENPHRECLKLLRDSSLCNLMGQQLEDDAFMRIWAQELSSNFGERALAPDITDGTPKGETRSPLPSQKKSPGDDYEEQIGPFIEAINFWAKACSWDEYLELASLLPFLRLFEREKSNASLVGVVGKLARDYCEVWRDSESPEGAHDAARRFAVALAAMEVFRLHRSSTKIGPCLGEEADQEIMVATKMSAEILLRQVRSFPAGRARNIFKSVWTGMAGHSSEDDDPHAKSAGAVAQPIILKGMVRFLVRMLHNYRADGKNVRPKKERLLDTVDEHLRNIFIAGSTQPNHFMPAKHISELWAFQYRLTEARENIDYLFDLEEADFADFAGQRNPTP